MLVLKLAGLIAHASSAGTVAVYIEDDITLPPIIGIKTRSDLEATLLGGALSLVGEGDLARRLGEQGMPVCLQDDACWRSTATLLAVDRLIIVEIFPDGDREVAEVRVVEPAQQDQPALFYEVQLPRGGGFPIETAYEITQMPLYNPPPPVESERKGLLARIFGRN